MLASLKQVGLPAPIFDNRIASFRVTFFNAPRTLAAPADPKKRRDRRDDILGLMKGRGEMSRAEIAQQLELTDAATRRWLAVLRDEGSVVTVGGQARSKNVRYRLTRA